MKALLPILAALALPSCIQVGNIADGMTSRVGATVGDVAAAESVQSVLLHRGRKGYGIEWSWNNWGFGFGLWPVVGKLFEPATVEEAAGREDWEIIKQK